ncbi:MarR family winged helix-turn-helix transcriptional regulator [Streptomyces sp. NPDC091268]|uniref:MarR family winged helix-turn-helix transcriptional regulator n=1 Tax=Streptomyces sp. NPDC091268 TaxID=3365979 RepID=UPI0038161B99
MDRAGPPEDPLRGTAQEVADAAGALMDLWGRIAQATPPRLSHLQVKALVVVRRVPGVNLTRLAEEVGTGPPATSRLCDRLEAAGLLKRRRLEGNRREIGLTLTLHGQETLDHLQELRAEALEKVLNRMPPEQRRHLVDGLRAFAKAMNGDGTATGTG